MPNKWEQFGRMDINDFFWILILFALLFFCIFAIVKLIKQSLFLLKFLKQVPNGILICPDYQTILWEFITIFPGIILPNIWKSWTDAFYKTRYGVGLRHIPQYYFWEVCVVLIIIFMLFWCVGFFYPTIITQDYICANCIGKVAAKEIAYEIKEQKIVIYHGEQKILTIHNKEKREKALGMLSRYYKKKEAKIPALW